MNQSTPAIVAQGAVRRLPRLALLLLCAAYVLPGFLGRDPWKSADMAAYGYMAELARGGTDWLSPHLMGLAPDDDSLLPYWLGAWAIQWAPSWMASDLAARIPFAFMLMTTLFAIWYASYYLARNPQAQPVAFAFGGEARPPDYARAMADASLLAFIACLGLAQLSHETTSALAQLCFTSLLFFTFAALPYRTLAPALCAVVGMTGLTLSGAPFISALLGSGCILVYLLDRSAESGSARRKIGWAVGIALLAVMLDLLALWLNLWHWHIELPEASWTEWRSLGRLLLWFTWPAWPLVLWTLWRWRHQLIQGAAPSRHLSLPLLFSGLAVAATFGTAAADRSLLLALPALAALAAFALPTLKRSVAALIDWFTLLFFSSCALVIWIIWIALQTGVPSQPAANVARLAPGFQDSFSLLPFALALMATLAWAWLVKWRAGRNRAAIWKSLVLPAGGAALCFLLTMTLWLPALNFARSYAPLMRQISAVTGAADCVKVHGLSRGHIAALRWHSQLVAEPVATEDACPWLIVNKEAMTTLPDSVDLADWSLQSSVHHPSDRDENLLIYKRIAN